MSISVVTGIFAFWAYKNLAWPFAAVAIYLHCTLYGFFGGGTGTHELSHNTVFRSRILNDFFIRLLGTITYVNFVQFRGNHTRHHLHTTKPGVDLEVMLPITYKRTQWIWGFTFDLPAIKKVFPAMLRHCFGLRGGDSKQDNIVYPSDDPGDIRLMERWSRIILSVHLALAIVFVATGNWILLFLVTLAPHSARWLAILTHQPQHLGMRGNVADWRQNTRTYLSGWFIRFIYWNMNYHVEHHMYASVPFYHLPKLRKAIEFDLPVAPKGLVATWREIFDAMKRQRVDPGYFVTPELPNTAAPWNNAILENQS